MQLMQPTQPQKGHALALWPVARHLGVNLPGWLISGQSDAHYRTFVSDADLARLVNWRFSHVRLPLAAALLDDPGGWSALDIALAACRRHRLAVVLALEWPDHDALVVTPDAWQRLSGVWRALAERYRVAGPELVFDLLDQPALPDDVSPEVLSGLGAVRLAAAARQRTQAPGATAARTWNALAARLTVVIRETEKTAGVKRPLVVQSLGGQPERFSQLRPTRDAETVYGFRYFIPEALALRGEGTYPGSIEGERWDRERLHLAMMPALEFRKTYSAPVYVTAFGVTLAAARQSRLTWIRSFLTLCRGEGLGWAYWAYSDPDFSLTTNDASGANSGEVDYDLLGVLQSE
jgi:hypothetical protein